MKVDIEFAWKDWLFKLVSKRSYNFTSNT